MEDREIVALYHARDEGAISETAAKYGAFCLRIALNLLGIREDADECVNDTYLAAWRRMPPELPASLRAFLGRITRNLSISRYRANHAQKRFAGAEVLLSELADCVPAPENIQRTVEAGELGELISRWLDGLGEEDRALFLRRYWNGDAVKDLALELGVRPNALTKRLLRLRESLRRSLEREGVAV